MKKELTQKEKQNLYDYGMSMICGCSEYNMGSIDEIAGECPMCEAPVDVYGNGLFGCCYGTPCPECGSADCNGSC